MAPTQACIYALVSQELQPGPSTPALSPLSTCVSQCVWKLIQLLVAVPETSINTLQSKLGLKAISSRSHDWPLSNTEKARVGLHTFFHL